MHFALNQRQSEPILKYRLATCLLSLLLLGLPSYADTVVSYVTEDGVFRFDLPDGWIQVPDEKVDVVNALEEVLQEFASEKKWRRIDAAFQPSSVDWFRGPYVLLFLNHEGRLSKGHLEETGILEVILDSLGSINNWMSLCKDGQVLFDSERNAYFQYYRAIPDGADTTSTLICTFLTSDGSVELKIWCTDSEWFVCSMLFNRMVESAIIAEGYRYDEGTPESLLDGISTESWRWIGITLFLATFSLLFVLNTRRLRH